MAAPEVFNFKPDPGASLDVKPRVKEKRYGDGYVQRVVDGINTRSYTLNVKFSHRTAATILSMQRFLDRKIGVVQFRFYAYGVISPGVIIPTLWVCTKYSHSKNRGGLFTFNATFVHP